MQHSNRKSFFYTLIIIFTLSAPGLFSQNILINNFENYPNNDSLKAHWKAFGFSTLDFNVVLDTINTPIGKRYLSYTYSGNSQTTWGGAVEETDFAVIPLNLSSAEGGIQFYLKGDGTGNLIYVRLSNGESNWSSNKISLKDSTWHAVYIPYVVDTTNGFSNGTETTEQLLKDLASVTDFRIYVDHPKIDNTPYTIYFDEIYSVKHLPPQNSIMLEDWETYKNTDSLKIAWQFFGYSTLDYNLKADPVNAQSGFKYIDYMYVGDNQTTWGGAMRTKNLIPVDLSNVKAGIQFYLKGDGSVNNFSFRFYNGNDMWSSYKMPLSDTTWHLVTVPFIVDTLKGFRYLGNNPDNPVIGPDIGTNDMMKTDLANVTQVRFYVYRPVIDFIHYTVNIDGLYAVDKFPPLPSVPVDDFESYATTNDLTSAWQQFGDASVSLALTVNSDSVASGSKAAVITYKGAPGTQYTAIRRKNIIPGLNFSKLNGGIQFWLKGDGSSNKIIFRFYNGNEMWASSSVSLSSTSWKHIGLPFAIDTVNGFRYLGNDPTNPNWSGDLGTVQQLYGDLANVDQVRFDILNPEQNNITYSVVVDGIEGVDQFSPGVITSVSSKGNYNIPKQYNLNQNYPNPFNPNTIISYQIPKNSLVTLKIYNILGQEVATLINEEQIAGDHNVSFNAAGLSSGVYFYSLKAGNQPDGKAGFMSTKKMLLLK